MSMVLTILFVAAACMTVAFVSWTVGYKMSLNGFWLAKRFYVFKKDLKVDDRTISRL